MGSNTFIWVPMSVFTQDNNRTHWDDIILQYIISMHFVFKDFCLFTVHFLPKCYFLSAKHWTPTPSHRVWISEFTALTLQPRRRIQWRMPEVFHPRQSRGCCWAQRTGLCLRCSSAAICRAWLGCSSDLPPSPGTQQSQPRVRTSLDLGHLPNTLTVTPSVSDLPR